MEIKDIYDRDNREKYKEIINMIEDLYLDLFRIMLDYKNVSYSRMVKIVDEVYFDMPELRKIALDQVRRTYKYSIGGVR